MTTGTVYLKLKKAYLKMLKAYANQKINKGHELYDKVLKLELELKEDK